MLSPIVLEVPSNSGYILQIASLNNKKRQEKGAVLFMKMSSNVSISIKMSPGAGKMARNGNIKADSGVFYLPLIARITVTTRAHIFPLIISIRLTGIEKIAVMSGIQTHAGSSILK